MIVRTNRLRRLQCRKELQGREPAIAALKKAQEKDEDEVSSVLRRTPLQAGAAVCDKLTRK